jgi:rsbT antagonist protein RsbS
MEVPILMVDGFWITSIQEALHDQSVLDFQQKLLSKLKQPQTRGLVIDLTALDLVDSFVTKALLELCKLAKLMGIQVIVTGMNPAVAITLVEMGLDLRGIDTALDLQRGLDKLRNCEER